MPTRSTLNKGAHSTARVWRIIDGLLSTMVVAARSTLNKGAHSTARTCEAYQTFSRTQSVDECRTPAARRLSFVGRRTVDFDFSMFALLQARHRPAPDPHAATSVGAVGRA